MPQEKQYAAHTKLGMTKTLKRLITTVTFNLDYQSLKILTCRKENTIEVSAET